MAAYSSEEVDKWLKRLEDVGVRRENEKENAANL